MLGKIERQRGERAGRRLEPSREEDDALSRDQVRGQRGLRLVDDLGQPSDEIVLDDVLLLPLVDDLPGHPEQFPKLRWVHVDVPVQVGEVREQYYKPRKNVTCFNAHLSMTTMVLTKLKDLGSKLVVLGVV